MLYRSNGASASPRALSGASLAQLVRRKSAAARALLAAEIIDGKIIVQGLTIKAVATIAGCSVGSVFAALRLTPEQREAVERGQRPLVLPQPPAPSMAIDWTKVDDETLTDTVRQVGIERVLEAAAAVERVTIRAHA